MMTWLLVTSILLFLSSVSDVEGDGNGGNKDLVHIESKLKSYSDVGKLGMSGNFFGPFAVPRMIETSRLDAGCERNKINEGGGGDSVGSKCKNPPLICHTISCCLPNGRCGCLEGETGRCEDVKRYTAQLTACTFDGLKVGGDFELGIRKLTGGSGSRMDVICSESVGRGADAFAEANEDGGIGIRIRAINCWNASFPLDWGEHLDAAVVIGDRFEDTGVIVAGLSFRIEDPDGFLVEKFLMRVLENVDLIDIINEFGEEDYEWGGVGDTEKLEQLSGVGIDWPKLKEFMEPNHWSEKNGFGMGHKWGCQAELNFVSMDPGFMTNALIAILPDTGATGSCSEEGICKVPPPSCPESNCCYLNQHQHLVPSNTSTSNSRNGACGCYDNSTGTCNKIKSLEANWRTITGDGMMARTQVLNYFPMVVEECEDDGASVNLEPIQSEWSLIVTLSQCIKIPSQPFLSGNSLNNLFNTSNTGAEGINFGGGVDDKLVRFTGGLTISEGSIYKRMLNVVKQFRGNAF